MRITFLLLLYISITAFRLPPTSQSTSVNSVLKAAVVYRNGAELSHTANANLKQGNNELIIDNISSYVDINSIQVNCPATVTILGMEFSNNYLGEQNLSPAAAMLTDTIISVYDEVKKVDVLLTTYSELLDILRVNKLLKGEQTGLNVAELTKLMNYYEAKFTEINNKQNTLTQKKNKLQKLLTKLNNQLEEEKKKNTASGGRLILQLSVATPGSHTFNISYITQNAYWVPYYDVKAENIKSPLKFIYKAKIAQTTGIDWKKVKLTLSTSTPTQFGNAPEIKTWFLGYIDPYKVMTKNLDQNNMSDVLEGKVAELSVNEVVVTGYGTSKIKMRGSGLVTGGNDPLYIVNGTVMPSYEFSKISPDAIAKTEILKNASATSIYGSRGANGVVIVTLKDGLEDYVSVTNTELDVTYDIDIPYDVPTNGKLQIATLQQTDIKANYKYYAVPKIDKEAFLMAEIVDWQTLNLLPGEANVIFEGTYIGKTFIDPANTNDTLNLTLGSDKRLVIKREKRVDFSSTKLIGQNKVQAVTYDIIVRNNKAEPIKLELKDQYPITKYNDIDVKLLEHSNGNINDITGIITWTMNLNPGENKKVNIGYSAKYPKEKIINFN